MPGTTDLKEFVEERLLAYDPDIDITDDSPAQITIIDPIVRRFTPDPFEMDIESFIRARLEQEYPGLNADEGEALADLLIKPVEALLDPIIREVQFLRNNKSLSDPEILSPQEADSLMGNIFVRRNRGGLSVGVVRIWFNSPTAVFVTVGNVASTGDGLNFIPSSPQSISAEQMMFNQDGNLFYMDVSFQAEQEGDEYNVEPRTITSISNLPAAVKVRNLYRFRDGTPEESTLAFIDRGENSLTERSLVVPRGVLATLFDQFGELQHIQVVGFNDPEMMRDVLKGGGLGSAIIYGVDGASSDDGDGDGYSDIFESAGGGFIENIGPVGSVSDFVLIIEDKDYPILEVISDTMLKVGASFVLGSDPIEPPPHPDMPDNLSGAQFLIRKSLINLSDIPGGIFKVVTSNGILTVRNDEVHIGGCTDFYIRGTSLEESEQVLEAVTDEQPLMEGLTLDTKVTGLPEDVVRDLSLDSNNNFLTNGVQPGHTLVIETDAGSAGTYHIIKVSPDGAINTLQVDPAPPATVSNQKYKIVDNIDVNLVEPKTVRGSGTDLKTVMGSTQVSTVSEVDFDQLGVEQGDVLRISGESVNAGDYNVEQIVGTGNISLVLGTPLRKTSSSETWQVFKAQEVMNLPTIRITSLELLDSSKQPTGETIPYADPIDIQSYAFSNMGIGEKIQVNDAVIGILSEPIITPSLLDGKALKFTINNGTIITITFSGITTVQDAVDQINAGSSGYNIAAVYETDEGTRLSIRSRNNWIQINPYGSANEVFGFSATVSEDNRQLKSESVSDWTAESLDIEAESDVVYILTGSNIEFWYIHAVEENRLLISRVEDGRAVFPLTDSRASSRIGSRSFGKLRCYFLEPTSFEVRGSYRKAAISDYSPNTIYGSIVRDEPARTEFSLDVFGDESAFYKFFPDPTLQHQVLPATEEQVPDNLLINQIGDKFVESENAPASGIGKDSRSDEIDFLLREILPGDILEITYQPIQGTADIRATPTGTIDYDPDTGNIVTKTLVISMENGPDKTVTFSAEVDGPDRLAAEINNQLGETIAYVETESVSGEKYLRLEADFFFNVRSAGTANSVLGLSYLNNYAQARGKYVISDAGYVSGSTSNHMRLSISHPIDSSPGAWTGFDSTQIGPSQHFKIYRPGVQRVSSTEMQDNVDGTLYYADIEVVSEGPGDEFNIDADLQLDVDDHKSDGYTLYNTDENMAFSEFEDIRMILSRRFLTPGSTDSPENMTLISQQNIQINYERSSLVEQIQSFANSDLDRVLNASILVRHLVPHFIQFELNYSGGSQSSVVESDITDLIDGLLPDEILESSAIAELVRKRGASRVEMPIDMIGVVHQIDRKIRAMRSQDFISRGRLSTFISDNIQITRESI